MFAGSELHSRISTDQDVLVSSWRDPHGDAKIRAQCQLVVCQIRFAAASDCDNAVSYIRENGLAQWEVRFLACLERPFLEIQMPYFRFVSANWDLGEVERDMKARIVDGGGLVNKLCIPP
jgi:hypothetical protein